MNKIISGSTTYCMFVCQSNQDNAYLCACKFQVVKLEGFVKSIEYMYNIQKCIAIKQQNTSIQQKWFIDNANNDPEI